MHNVRDGGYRVRIVSGPAKGWEYITLIPPEEMIAVAPNPSRREEWMRVVIDDLTWPDEMRYRREEIDEEDGERTEDGDLIVEYEVLA